MGLYVFQQILLKMDTTIASNNKNSYDYKAVMWHILQKCAKVNIAF